VSVHVCRPRVGPLRIAGVPTGWNGKSVNEWGHGSLAPMVAAFERTQLMEKCWSRCVGSLFVKNMTIGIAMSLRTTPQNGHTLAVLTGQCAHPTRAIPTKDGSVRKNDAASRNPVVPGRWAMLPPPGQRLPAFTGRAKSGSCTVGRLSAQNPVDERLGGDNASLERFVKDRRTEARL
jgi:hypothetical protein